MDKTALLVIDVQNDFCKENSKYHKMGYPIILNSRLAVKIKGFIEKTDVKVFFIISNYDDFTIKGENCVFCHRGTEGAKSYIDEKLADEIIIKNTHDGFYNTQLEDILMKYSIKKILIAGISTAVCIDSTARSAVCRGYNTTIIKDLVVYRDNKIHEIFLDNFNKNIGFVKGLGEIENGCKTSEKRT